MILTNLVCFNKSDDFFKLLNFQGSTNICKNTSMVPLIKQCWIRPWVRKEKNGRKKKKDQGSRRLLICCCCCCFVLFCFVLYRSLNTSQDYACMALSDTSWVLLNILKYSVLSVFSMTNIGQCVQGMFSRSLNTSRTPPNSSGRIICVYMFCIVF